MLEEVERKREKKKAQRKKGNRGNEGKDQEKPSTIIVLGKEAEGYSIRKQRNKSTSREEGKGKQNKVCNKNSEKKNEKGIKEGQLKKNYSKDRYKRNPAEETKDSEVNSPSTEKQEQKKRKGNDGNIPLQNPEGSRNELPQKRHRMKTRSNK